MKVIQCPEILGRSDSLLNSFIYYNLPGPLRIFFSKNILSPLPTTCRHLLL